MTPVEAVLVELRTISTTEKEEEEEEEEEEDRFDEVMLHRSGPTGPSRRPPVTGS